LELRGTSYHIGLLVGAQKIAGAEAAGGMMTRDEILGWVAEHRQFCLATVEGDQPRVRVFGSALVIDEGVHFLMGKGKDVYTQVCTNPAVEMCFYDADEGVQVRVSGEATLVTGDAIWEKVFELMPFARTLVERRGVENMALFRVQGANALVWTRETTSAPKKYVVL
jgi:uncharacterized pyridoxamine 5'-phosphate oxidase family protein